MSLACTQLEKQIRSSLKEAWREKFPLIVARKMGVGTLLEAPSNGTLLPPPSSVAASLVSFSLGVRPEAEPGSEDSRAASNTEDYLL